jgi:hypothetical protein
MLVNLIPKTPDQAMELAIRLSKSTIIPKDYQNKPEDTLVAILMGAEIGLNPLQSIQGIAVINGRPCIWGDTLLAKVQESGLLVMFDETFEGDLKTNLVAKCVIKRKDMENTIERIFSMDDAKRAKLWDKDIYQKYPYRMLQMRARSFALRDAFADILKGLYIKEEVEDYTIEKDITTPAKSQTLIEELEQKLHSESPHDQIVLKEEIPLMPIGKYKGKRVDEISANYLHWLSANHQKYKPLAEQELARRQTNV